MAMHLYSESDLVCLKDSPYFEEMKQLKDKKISDKFYFSPSEFDKSVGDVSKIEARLIRMISRLVENDANYYGLVQISEGVIKKYACSKEFSPNMVFIALKKLTGNVAEEGNKPLITRVKARERVYWVNPAVMCKKSLIDKFIEDVPADYVPEKKEEEAGDEAEEA